MRKESRDFIEEVYESERANLEGISFERFHEICSSPWKLLKREMSSGRFNFVRMERLGIFRIYKNRAITYLEKVKEMKTHIGVDKCVHNPDRIRELERDIEAWLLKNKDKDDKIRKIKDKGVNISTEKGSLLVAGDAEVQAVLQ